jgi:hypothetical protein
MADDIGESITKTKTFCFASGEILTLDENQIEKIPYLTAIVSSGDHLESSRDENGHYKLDRGIKYKHFSFSLDSLTFHSVRQLFTRLPEQNDVIPIIALLDFLGIGPQPDPSLKEVDLVFFHNLVYSPLLKKYIQIVRPCVIRDMAVRFAIAMAEEEYDFSKREIIDQIYWFIMFILSAHKLFGPRLRYHVYKIAEHCFSLFEPSLLKPLDKLIKRTNIYIRKLTVIIGQENLNGDEENNQPLERILDLGNVDDFDIWWPTPILKQRQELLSDRTYSNHSRYWGRLRVTEESLLEPIYKRVSEIVYERLQSEVCQRAVTEISKRKSPPELAEKRNPFAIFLFKFERESLPNKIGEMFELEAARTEIHERILEEICVLIPKLKSKHVGLVKEIQEYSQNQETSHQTYLNLYDYFLFGGSYFERIQEEALCCEITLDKLSQRSNIVEQIHQRVLGELRLAAQQQLSHWKSTQQDIDELHDQLSPYQPLENFISIIPKAIPKRYQIPMHKPLPKLQLKYSAR